VQHAAYMCEIEKTYKIVVRKPEEKNHFEELGISRRIILKWI
jgi:hypothetical protein